MTCLDAKTACYLFTCLENKPCIPCSTSQRHCSFVPFGQSEQALFAFELKAQVEWGIAESVRIRAEIASFRADLSEIRATGAKMPFKMQQTLGLLEDLTRDGPPSAV